MQRLEYVPFTAGCRPKSTSWKTLKCKLLYRAEENSRVRGYSNWLVSISSFNNIMSNHLINF